MPLLASILDLVDFGDVLPNWIAQAEAAPPRRRRRAESYPDLPADVELARERLAALEPAVEGHGGDTATFRAACIGRDLGLSPATFLPLLQAWNARCVPPWPQDQLAEKLRNAYRYAKAATPGTQGAAAFEELPIPADPPKPAAETERLPAAPAADVSVDFRPEWEAGLCTIGDSGRWMSIPRNVELAFDHDDKLRGTLRFNRLTGAVEVLQGGMEIDPASGAKRRIPAAPWRQFPGPVEWCDDDWPALHSWLIRRFDKRAIVGEIAIQRGARMWARRANSYHPLQDWLRTLRWDGTPRAARWLVDYLGAEDTPYVRAVGERFLIAAVARAMQPGCKVDSMLVLEGEQGTYKSTACRTLFGDAFFTDGELDVGNKDAAAIIRGRWCVEFQEMTANARAEVNAMKAFVTRRVDRQRDAYARVVEDHPRSCVFIGTTNQAAYLRDATGGRRFWPVPVARGRIDAIARDREQLWAEAMTAYELGEPWWLTDDEGAAAAGEQDRRYLTDEWEAPILAWIERGGDLGEPGKEPSPMVRVTGFECYLGALGGTAATFRRDVQLRIADILERLGWRRGVYRVDGRCVKGYLRMVATVSGSGRKGA